MFLAVNMRVKFEGLGRCSGVGELGGWNLRISVVCEFLTRIIQIGLLRIVCNLLYEKGRTEIWEANFAWVAGVDSANSANRKNFERAKFAIEHRLHFLNLSVSPGTVREVVPQVNNAAG